MTVPSVVQPPVNQRVPTSPPGPASATQKPATPHNAGGIFDKAKKALKDHIAGWVGGQEATPTHTPTKGPSLEQKNALRLLPPEDRLALLIEIRDGNKNVPEQRRKLQKAVKAHIRMQLDPTDEISPGLFATGFDHVRHIKSVDAVIPDGWFPRGDEILITEIVNASIEHLSKNDTSTPPPANAISFEQIIEGTKPTSNPEAQSLSAPICGVDGIGNRVVLLPAANRDVIGVAEFLDETHSGPVNLSGDKLNGDNFSWTRAAWLSYLCQTPPSKIDEKLRERLPNESLDVIWRIAAMAERLQGEGGIEAVTSPGKSPGQGRTLTYRHGGDCEKDLKRLTDELLKAIKAETKQPFPKDGDRDTFLVTSLLNYLGADSIILDHTRNTDGQPLMLMCGADVKSHFEESLKTLSPQVAAEQASEYCVERPVIIKTAEGYSFRTPDHWFNTDDEESGNTDPIPEQQNSKGPAAPAA